MKRFIEFWNQRRKNAAELRRIADDVGREIEQWPYERFLAPAGEISFSRVIDGLEVHFSIEEYEENEAGDLHICVDVGSRLPTASPVSPSYVFWKRPDGSVYYA